LIPKIEIVVDRVLFLQSQIIILDVLGKTGHHIINSHSQKATDNRFIGAFNSKLGAECLNAHWFLTLEDAREKLENWY